MNKPKEPKLITELYAFVSVDEDGGEGICAYSSGLMMLLMIGADMERVDYLMPIAQDISNLSGKPITVRRFKFDAVIGGILTAGKDK